MTGGLRGDAEELLRRVVRRHQLLLSFQFVHLTEQLLNLLILPGNQLLLLLYLLKRLLLRALAKLLHAEELAAQGLEL